MKYFTSDLHDFHNNVIRYCDRPYKDVNEMHWDIVNKWNAKVTNEDTVYVLGDISLNANVACRLPAKLNGYKILIPGNHDKCFAFKGRQLDQQLKKYKDGGWNEIHQSLNMILSNGLPVHLNHFPYKNSYAEQFDARYLEYRPIDLGGQLFHGHMHCKYLKSGQMVDVGWDNKLDVYSEQELIDIINDLREYIPSRITEFYKKRVDNRKVEY